MLFFRSEDEVQAWCRSHGYPKGPLVSMLQLWGMATAFYSTRLEENSQRPQAGEIRGIFAGIGLVDEFWDPLSQSFN